MNNVNDKDISLLVSERLSYYEQSEYQKTHKSTFNRMMSCCSSDECNISPETATYEI